MSFRINPRLARKAQSTLHQLRSKLIQPLRNLISAGSRGEHCRIGLPEDADYVFRPGAYGGSRQRQYRVHFPANWRHRKDCPLVMVLHGCRQTHDDIATISDFNRIADREGFIVLYPFVTSYAGFRTENCWGWFVDSEIHAGSGEVEDLWGIVEEVSQRYPVDRTRIHVTGLSSGAGITVALLVAHGDKIASGAPVAGLPYAESATAVKSQLNYFPVHRDLPSIVAAMQQEMGGRDRLPPIQIIQSVDDETVDKQSAYNLRDSWGQLLGLDTGYPLLIDSGGSGPTRWQHERLPADKTSQIETLFISGVGHGWSGGKAGAFSFPEGPDIAEFIWTFFKSHRL